MRPLSLIFVASLLAAQPQAGMLLYEQTREGVDRLLAECAAKGITQMDLVILPAGEPRPNANGDYAMGYGGQPHDDLSLPNPAFFQHLDWVLKKFSGRQIVLRLLPVDRNSALFAKNSPDKFLEWGRYLGRRYMKSKHLIWLRQSEQSAGSLLALEEGIRLFDSVHRLEWIKPL
jgi:hypothetical protein